MVNPATALGRSGLHDWFIQRVSAVVVAAYVLYLFVFFASNQVSFDVWQQLFAGTGFKVFSLVTLLALVAHAWIGVWTVFTDYIKPVGVRFVAQSLLILTCLTVLVWGVTILWGV